MLARHRLAFALLVPCFSGAVLRLPAQQTARIRAVENGLIPSVRIKGRPLPPMTLAARMKKYHVPAVSIAVIDDYAMEWTKAYGLAEPATRTPADTGTLFPVGSLSQPIAATVALSLAQAKKLDLDRDVNRSLKSWKIPKSDLTKNRPVTVRRLLAHSAGLTTTTAPGYAPEAPLPTLAQILAGVPPTRTPPIAVQQPPGQDFRISASDYVVLQQVLLDATRRPFGELATETVLRPLGMTRSVFQQPLAPPFAAWAAAGHDSTGKPLAGKWRVYPEEAAAGFWTTAPDLARFAVDLELASAGKPARAFKPETAKQMLGPEHVGWPGLGVMIEGRDDFIRFRVAGTTQGFESEMVAYARRGQGAVVLTNAAGGGALIDEILNGIARVYGWPDYVPAEKVIAKVDWRVYDRFVGTYSADGRTVSVTRRANRLFIGAAGKERTELLPESVNDFFTPDSDAQYSFVFDQNGKVQAFTVRRRDEYARWNRSPG